MHLLGPVVGVENWERLGFQQPQGDQQVFMYQKEHVWSLLLHRRKKANGANLTLISDVDQDIYA